MKRDRIPVAKDGVPFIAGGAFITLTFAVVHWVVPCLLGMVLTFLCYYFFRDPERSFSYEEGTVVSPADGVVLSVENGFERRYLNDQCIRLSIFMSVLDVHVNRFPVNGTVRDIQYRPGGFLRANRDGAAGGNEQNALTLEMATGARLVMVQVAGLIARRIVCLAEVGDTAVQGARMGMIRFGSRVDLLLPTTFQSRVKKGDRVRAGETILGVLP